MENCQHGNFAPVETLKLLPHSQAGLGRHKCVICAYQEGLRLGIQSPQLTNVPLFPIRCDHGKTAPEYLLVGLPYSQAGTGRHKCAVCAFYDGFIEGLELGPNSIVIEQSNQLVTVDDLVQVDIPAFGENPFSKLKRTYKAKKGVDYKNLDSQRKDLGILGEKLVYEYEKRLLINNHLQDLASKMIHTSVTEGDGAGYDILSYTLTGEKKFIEVKTTLGLMNAPFYMSANEVDFSKQNSQNYYLYRVFDFKQKEEKGKFYLFQGDVTNHFHFNPLTFQVSR